MGILVKGEITLLKDLKRGKNGLSQDGKLKEMG